MLSKISSRSGKRLILSALHKFIANIKSKSATPNAPIAQYLSLANFSGPNNLNNNVGYASSHCGRAYSTNYFKPVSKIAITFQQISQQNRVSNQQQDKIITMLKSTDSFVQTLEMLDSFWQQCSDSNKSNGLFRLSRLPKERFQIRLPQNRNRVKGLYDKVLKDIKQIQFNPKQLSQILEFLAVVEQTFPYMINQKQLEDFALKVKEAIENPTTQFHITIILFSKSGPFKSSQIVQAFWNKTLENKQNINVTPKLIIGLISSLKNFDHPFGTLYKIFNFYSKHSNSLQKQLRETVQLFRIYSELSDRFQLKRNDYINMQKYLLDSMQNFEENDVIDILNAFAVSKGKIIRELPQNLYKFLNLGIKHNSNTYSSLVIQRIISLIPQMSNSIVKPNKQFATSLFSYMMNRSSHEFSNRPNNINNRMISSLAKIAYTYQLNEPQIAHFLLNCAPEIKLSFSRMEEIQELTTCYQRFINNQNQDPKLKNELRQIFSREFLKLSSNKENPAQGDFIKRIMIANILRNSQAEKQRTEEYKQFIEQIENPKFLLDFEFVKFMLSSRYSSQTSKSIGQLIFSKNEIFEAFKFGNQYIQYSVFMIMNNRDKKDLISQALKDQVNEYFQNMSLAKQFRMIRFFLNEKRFFLMNENIYNEILRMIQRIEKRLEEDRGLKQQGLNLRIQFLQMLNSNYLASNRFASNKRYIKEFMNNEIAGDKYSNLKMRYKVRLFNVLRNFSCPQSIRVLMAQQFQKDIIGSDKYKVNLKYIGYMAQEYTNYFLYNQSLEQRNQKLSAFLEFLGNFTGMIKQINEAISNKSSNQQSKQLLNSVNYYIEKDYILQNCTDIQTSLGKLRKNSKEIVQKSLKESQEYDRNCKILEKIGQMTRTVEEFYIQALKPDSSNNQSLVKFLASVLEMDSNSWQKYQSDSEFRQQFDRQILRKNQEMSLNNWLRIFQRQQKIILNWALERQYNLKHFTDPRKNLMNEFARDYQNIGSFLKPSKNASVFKLMSIGKIKNTNFLNNFLTNFGDKYQSYNFSELVSVAESLGQFGLVRSDIFQKVSQDILKMSNSNMSAFLVNNLIAVGARNMSYQDDWLKQLAERHTKQVFQWFMQNEVQDINLSTFLETAYILFKREGFQVYETLIPRLFQKFTQNITNTAQFGRSFSTFFVNRLSSNTEYVPQNLRIPELKMQHKTREDYTLKNKFSLSNTKDSFNFFKNELFIKNFNISQLLLQALNKGETEEKLGNDALNYYKDYTDIYVPSRDLGVVIHGIKDYCFNGEKTNNYHFLRRQEALSSNIKNIVYLEWSDLRRVNSKENLIQSLSAKLDQQKQS